MRAMLSRIVVANSHGELPTRQRRMAVFWWRRVSPPVYVFRGYSAAVMSGHSRGGLLVFCSSYSGYGKIGFDRRFRMYEISDYGETIRTWKHTEHLESWSLQTLVGYGAAPPYEDAA